MTLVLTGTFIRKRASSFQDNLLPRVGTTSGVVRVASGGVRAPACRGRAAAVGVGETHCRVRAPGTTVAASGARPGRGDAGLSPRAAAASVGVHPGNEKGTAESVGTLDSEGRRAAIADARVPVMGKKGTCRGTEWGRRRKYNATGSAGKRGSRRRRRGCCRR